MNIVILQTRLPLKDVEHLLQEFPHYLFLSFSEASYKNLTPDNWAQVEILYGNRLTPQELEKAHQLHWIHCPTPEINQLCLDEIEKRGNIIITSVKEANLIQIGEFVMSATLAFAKNLIHWQEADKFPTLLGESKWRDTMWSLEEKLFLQIGLDKVGTEITRKAHEMKMKVWGVQKERSFHPNCQKTFPMKEMHSILPNADVVCLNLPRAKEYENWFKMPELELMKNDSILIVMGSHKIVDEEALAKIAETGKFRGILIDALHQMPIPASSPLWQIPNIIITPEAAPLPKTHLGEAFTVFRYNLRQYVHANFKDMRNVVTKSNPMLV